MLKFYKCGVCGNIAIKVVDKKVPLFCCGSAMQEIKANTVDAALEKHVPAVTYEDGQLNVVVGSVLHPHTEAHYIQFIVVETTEGYLIKELSWEEEPKASFTVKKENVKAVYEYCNLHGLWKVEL